MIDVLRVGHATFTTPDLERQVAYYSDVLGLIVTDWFMWDLTPELSGRYRRRMPVELLRPNSKS